MCLLFAGWLLARRIVPADALASAWIVVSLVDPTSIFEPGCQLSFLCILVLHRIGMLREGRNHLPWTIKIPRACSVSLIRPGLSG